MMEKLSAEEFDRNYEQVKKRLSEAAERSGRALDDITLLAATKTVDAETINYAIRSGITHTGENRVQELISKEAQLIESHRHFIGHLQTNKVKDVVGRVELIESVDSIHLAKEISCAAGQLGRCMDILAEINVGGEENKSGFAPAEAANAVEELSRLDNIRVRGLMAIPPVCENVEKSRYFFKIMNKLFIDISAKKSDNNSMDILSMGMSGDFEYAVEEGATLVRVGTALFGKRNYNI